MSVVLGSTRLLASTRLRGQRVGIVSNPASVDQQFTHIVDALMVELADWEQQNAGKLAAASPARVSGEVEGLGRRKLPVASDL